MDNKKMFFTYIKNENGEISLNKVVTIESTEPVFEDFEVEKHGELFLKFMEENDITLDTLDSELEEKGIFDEEKITEEKLQKYIGDVVVVPSSDIDGATVTQEDELEPDEKTDVMIVEDESEIVEEEEEEEKSHVGRRIVAGTLLAATVVGLGFGLHSCSQEQVIEQTQDQTLEDLLNQMTPEQKAFFESSFKAVDEFNSKTTKEGNFKLDKDTSDLHMSVDEAIALNIVLNNYSANDLYEVFGTVEFDSANVMNLARSAYSKLSTYYMNAKEASGLSVMINDEAARQFFEKNENAVIEFNNNPTRELADKVINGLYDSYVVDGATGNYASINNDGVAWLSTSSAFGFELANRNVVEFLETTDGLSLNQVTGSELLNGINDEINIDVMDEVNNKGLCVSVYSATSEKINTLTTIQSVATSTIKINAKDELVEGLKESGNMSLANKVLNSEITPSLLEEISEANTRAGDLVNDYNDRIASLSEKEAKVAAVLSLAMEEYNVKADIDLASLVNNRFRSPLVLEREDNELTPEEQLKEDLYVGEDEQGTPVYDGDKLNQLPEEEKNQFIQDNGEIVDKKEEVVEKEEVKFEDLTPEEQEKVIDEEAILNEVEELKNNLIEQGVYDAVDYTEEIGAYKYDGTLTIPYNNQELDTNNMSLFNITAYDAAFGDKDINVNDEQIQERMDNDSEEIEDEIESLSSDAQEYLEDKYGSDWKDDFKEESYIYGYTEQIKGTLATAKGMASEIRKTAEMEYNKAQEEANKMNELEDSTKEEATPSVPPVVEEEVDIPTTDVPAYYPTGTEEVEDSKQEEVTTDASTVVEEEKNDTYDPNLDPNFGSDSEEVYIPTTDMPAYYNISDAEIEAAFNQAMSEETSGKTK